MGGEIEGNYHGMERQQQVVSESSPTYKLLFSASCIVIWAFIGYGIKDLLDRVGYLERIQMDNRIQLSQLTKDIERLREGHLAQNEAIAAIQRDIMQRERQRR